MDHVRCKRIEKKISKILERLTNNLEGLIDGANLFDADSINKICELDRTASNSLKQIDNYMKGVSKNSKFYGIFNSLYREINHIQKRIDINYQDIIKRNENGMPEERTYAEKI
ncbi:hypothetical protein KY313_03175 [Candidatus Woesearchaeota archaeon]|jgi:uncharacterized phage infection (PIP) family protein YhgE|nr:hypothetical protein [Candidatus Woesearchaeota archaeon]